MTRCLDQHFLVAFFVCIFAVSLTLIFLFPSVLYGKENTIREQFAPIDQYHQSHYNIPVEALVMSILIWILGGFIGLVSLCLFLLKPCDKLPETRNYRKSTKESCSKRMYCCVMVFVIPLTMTFIISALIFWSHETTVLNEKYDVHDISINWDKVQYTFECCGSKTYTEYGSYIPGSCCKGKRPMSSCFLYANYMSSLYTWLICISTWLITDN